MKQSLLLVAFIFSAGLSQAQAQRLSFGDMEKALNFTLIETEESLFLKGYSFAGNDTLNNGGVMHNFTTRGKTVKTAKSLSKAIYENSLEKGYVQYVTYEAGEFQTLRKLMIENSFTRTDNDKISENSVYIKDNLEVKFVTDESDKNRAFIVTLTTKGGVPLKKQTRKLSLKSLLKPD